MLKKVFLLVLFLFLLSNAFSYRLWIPGDPAAAGELMGFDLDFYSKTTSGSKTVFTLVGENVFFYAEHLYVIGPEENMNYFIKIPAGTTLMPCSGEGCAFSSGTLNSVLFDSSISGIILDGTLDTRGQYNNALHLVIEGDLNSTPNKNSGKIIASGRNGSDGNRFICITTDGENAGNPGRIEIRGKVFVSDYSTLTFDSSGGNGGKGADGIAKKSTYVGGTDECNKIDGKNGGNGTKGENISIETLVLSKSAGKVKFDSSGGNGGLKGNGIDFDFGDYQGIQYGEDGEDGIGEGAGNITINEILTTGNNTAPTSQPKLFFNAFKAELNPAEGALDGVGVIKGCNLKENLIIEECKLKRLEIAANDVIELMEYPDSKINSSCVLPRTQVTPKINCDCYSGSIEETEVIFSLTGTVKSFFGEDLSGEFQGFTLFKDLIDLDPEEVASDSSPYSFSNGFFNFSFGKNQPIFSFLGNLNFGFRYLLDFAINAAELTSSSQGKFSLATGEEEEQPCGE